MSRSDETEHDADVDLDTLLSEDARTDRSSQEPNQSADETASPSSGGVRSRLPSPSLPSLPLPRFTPRGLGLALVVCMAAFLAAGVVVPLGGAAGLVGVFGAGFLLGLLGRGRYLELAVAGAGTAAIGAVLDQLLLAAVADLAVPLTVAGGTAGLLAAVLGCYFGRDLRAGLTRDI